MTPLTSLDGKPLTIPGAHTYNIQQPLVFRYRPKEDITVYELATLVPFLAGRPLFENELTKLGTAKRHLEQVDTTPQPQIVT